MRIPTFFHRRNVYFRFLSLRFADFFRLRSFRSCPARVILFRVTRANVSSLFTWSIPRYILRYGNSVTPTIRGPLLEREITNSVQRIFGDFRKRNSEKTYVLFDPRIRTGSLIARVFIPNVGRNTVITINRKRAGVPSPFVCYWLVYLLPSHQPVRKYLLKNSDRPNTPFGRFYYKYINILLFT